MFETLESSNSEHSPSTDVKFLFEPPTSVQGFTNALLEKDWWDDVRIVQTHGRGSLLRRRDALQRRDCRGNQTQPLPLGFSTSFEVMTKLDVWSTSRNNQTRWRAVHQVRTSRTCRSSRLLFPSRPLKLRVPLQRFILDRRCTRR